MEISFSQFDRIYESLKANKDKLRNCCDNNKICWSPNENKTLTIRRGQGFLTYPYIGEDYRTYGTVVIGTNHRDNHHIDDYHAMYKLYKHKKDHRYICDILRKSEEPHVFYKNTAKYIKALRFGEIVQDTANWNNYKDVLKEIVLVQAIKCNPCRPKVSNNRQNQPTGQMWNNCPKHILFKELEIIKPRYILILGIGGHQKKLESLKALNYYQGNDKDEQHSVLYYSYLKSPDKKIDVYVANHPSWPGRKIESICNDLIELRSRHP